jgi:hypothetical protein
VIDFNALTETLLDIGPLGSIILRQMLKIAWQFPGIYPTSSAQSDSIFSRATVLCTVPGTASADTIAHATATSHLLTICNCRLHPCHINLPTKSPYSCRTVILLQGCGISQHLLYQVTLERRLWQAVLLSKRMRMVFMFQEWQQASQSS